MTAPLPRSPLPHRTIGIDLGDRKSNYCVLDDEGLVVDQGSLATERAVFQKRFGGIGSARVVIEVCTHARWVSQCFEELGHDVVVAKPLSSLPTCP